MMNEKHHHPRMGAAAVYCMNVCALSLLRGSVLLRGEGAIILGV